MLDLISIDLFNSLFSNNGLYAVTYVLTHNY